MKTNKALTVLFHGRAVGTLAVNGQGKVAFSYNDDWLESGFSISPFSLPLEKRVFVPDKMNFQGLFGVFADSLPDAWGQLLVHRTLKKHGIYDKDCNALDRLAVVGHTGMGALCYEPEVCIGTMETSSDWDMMAQECAKILKTEYSDKLDLLYRMGGTSGGARPKIMTNYRGQDWIIKFPAHTDMYHTGKMEYDYSVCAKRCQITMTETRLFPSETCDGYFGTVRFDRGRKDGERIHMISAAALLEADFEQPCMDYHDLMKLTKIMTENNKADMENMFRRACFNVFAHNRDDHAKNFAYLYQPETDSWHLSPAYDMTYSSTYYGEHTTSVDGNGKNPGEKELLAVGTKAGIEKENCRAVIAEIQKKVHEDLQEYFYMS